MTQTVKKQSLFFLFFVVGNLHLLAWGYNTNFAPNYQIGQTQKHLISGGIGMRVLDYDEFTEDEVKMILPFSFSYEYRMSELFGIGASTGFSRIKYMEEDLRTNEPDYIYSWSYIPIDLRLNFHFVSLVNEMVGADVPTNNIDLYASLFVGAEYRDFTAINDKMQDAVKELNNSSSVSNNNDNDDNDDNNNNRSKNLDEDKNYYKDKISNNPNIGFMLGIRYMFAKHIGLFLEGGKGPVSSFSIGVSASF